MEIYTYRAVANGLRTDHPIPDLPLVDDSHIPVDDPKGIEKIGRHPGTDTWGRQDRVRNSDSGGWTAFTTDPVRHDLAWCVRWHPEHGRSVIVYRDEEISGVHMSYWGPALLFRAGAYWWDGNGWYRPAQVWDAAREEYYRLPVPSSATVTAADLLRTGKPARPPRASSRSLTSTRTRHGRDAGSITSPCGRHSARTATGHPNAPWSR